VMFVKTHPGNESADLLLPSPKTTHVPATHVRADAPE